MYFLIFSHVGIAAFFPHSLVFTSFNKKITDIVSHTFFPSFKFQTILALVLVLSFELSVLYHLTQFHSFGSEFI